MLIAHLKKKKTSLKECALTHDLLALHNTSNFSEYNFSVTSDGEQYSRPENCPNFYLVMFSSIEAAKDKLCSVPFLNTACVVWLYFCTTLTRCYM